MEKKIEENLQKRLASNNTLSQVKQSLIVINRTIEELEEKKDNFNLNKNHEKDVQELNSIKKNINKISTRLSGLELRKELIEQSAEDLEQELCGVDAEKVLKLYEEAKIIIPHLQKTYEETLSFHNGMIIEKKKYITKEMPMLENQICQTRNDLNKLLKKEKDLSSILFKSGVIEDLEKIVAELNASYESKGSFEEQKKLWDNSVKKLHNINEEIKKIDKKIESLDTTIQERVSNFNEFFSEISDKIYGEKFVLSADKNEKGYELNITSLMGNPGLGIKKGEMAAFDLSYIQFADRLEIKCLHFILQDQIENIHVNQINSILTNVVETINCQYILPVLRDKLPIDINFLEYEILSLSQNDRLFKI